MSPGSRVEALVVGIDHAESRASATGRAIADSAEDLDCVARRLGADPGHGGWAGRAGATARAHTSDVAAGARMLSGNCLFLADVLRVEGARLARALIVWIDDDPTAAADSGLAANTGLAADTTEVEDADRALAERLREAADSLAGLADPATRPCIDLFGSTGDDPREVAELWHSLGPAERERLARDHPELGTVEGLSSATRDALNRTRLHRLLDAARTGAGGDALADVAPDLEALAAYVEADPRRHLLDLHPDGRAVVASGDPDSADRVVTLVPGTGSSLESLDRTGDRADALCEAATAGAETGSCVAVSWQGYDAPDSIAAAGSSQDPAREHAADLRTYAAGVDAVERLDGADSPHAAVGYSYGSVTLGAAAADPAGLAADRMIHVGSPGAAVDSIEEQWIDDDATSRPAATDEVVGVVSRWDAVPWWSITGILGDRPGTDDFGGLAVDVTEPGSGPADIRAAHSTYFDRGTVSLTEIGRLIADTD